MSDFFLADDLSGALDAAAAFHHAGRRVRVVLDATQWESAPDDDVVAVTTETRNAQPNPAARAVRAAIARGQAAGGKLLYKKIDSTLRGPVAAELAALADALPGARILFTPANPKVGRTVRSGVLFVRGVPVAETDFARDPVWPVRESAIAKLLGEVAARVAIADAETESDLDAAVARVSRESGAWVAVGSGALAIAVAKAQRGASSLPALERDAAFEREQAGRSAVDGVLLLGGSAHALNRAQAAELARAQGVAIHEIDPADIGRAVQAAAANLRAGASTALVLPPVRMASNVALKAVTEAARRTVVDTGATRIFATGGETAFALCSALGVRSLEFLREIEPGLALAGAGALRLAVKPGGFGDERTWVRAWTELRAAR